MSRLMSVNMTVDAVVERRKSVTRRLGWWLDRNGRQLLKAGDQLVLCEKVQGRKPGEPLVRLAQVEVVDVRRERLSDLTDLPGPYGRNEVAREGFPSMKPREFVRRFFVEAQGISPDREVTRIEWRYLADSVPTPGRRWTDPVRNPDGRTTLVKRCCNGCGRELGDAHLAELDAAICGPGLPDVRDECGCITICAHCPAPATRGTTCAACSSKEPDTDALVDTWKEDNRG